MLRKLCLALILTAVCSVAWAVDYTQDANCQGAWLFTEGSGTTVTDSSQNANTGNFKGAGEPAWYNSDSPAAYVTWSGDFDGTDDYLSMGDITDLDGESTIAFSSWIYADSLTSAPKIISKWGSAHAYLFQVDTAGAITGGVASTSNGICARKSANSVVTTGSWIHIVGQYLGSQVWQFYIDGTVDNTNANVVTTGDGVPIKNAVDVFYLGRDTAGDGDYNGRMTECAVFNRTLSSVEVNDIMDNGLVGSAGASFSCIYSASDIDPFNGGFN